MDEIPISEFKASCLRLIERVRITGVSLLVTKNGKPAAIVSPPQPTAVLTVKPGALKGRAKVLGDIVAPASEESEWDALS